MNALKSFKNTCVESEVSFFSHNQKYWLFEVVPGSPQGNAIVVVK
jgi:hypothetical protein